MRCFQSEFLTALIEMITWYLDDAALKSESWHPNDEEKRIFEETHEHVPLTMNFPCVYLVEQGHL